MSTADQIASTLDNEVTPEAAKTAFSHSIALLERLHQKLYDLIHLTLEQTGISDITPVQGLLLYNLGKHEIMVGELKSRGYYLGSNVSYNLKKLVNLGYVQQQQAPNDKRSTRVSLTVKGHRVRKVVTNFYDNNIEQMLTDCPLDFDDIQTAVMVMGVWDQFWAQELRALSEKQ